MVLTRVVDLILRTGHFVGRQNRLHAGHGERRARVDAPDARMRIRAQEKPRVQHALRAKIFGIACAPGHLGADVRGRVVLTNQLVFSHDGPLDEGSPQGRISQREGVSYTRKMVPRPSKYGLFITRVCE